MKLFGFAGYSGSGKTTLVEKLIPRFVSHPLRVSLIKHAHHTFDVDQPGKDSHRHRQAGCTEVLITSSRRWALMHELRGEPEPSFDEQLAHLSSCDLVLALDVFIYVGALERILPAIARVLDAGGRLLCSVEDLEEGDFALAPTGRYRHAPAYVERIGAAAGLILAQARPFIVRQEAGRAVEALMLALDKTG